jgi:hypothetical protein
MVISPADSETVHGFAAGLFDAAGENIESLSDDRLGRALDRLFEADRSALLTEAVLAVVKRFAVQLQRLQTTAPRSPSAVSTARAG